MEGGPQGPGGGEQRRWEKWSDSGYILTVEPTGVVDGPDVKYETKDDVKVDAKVSTGVAGRTELPHSKKGGRLQEEQV